jgi:hypothetical protein
MELLGEYAYRWPFVQPLPLWDWWWVLLVPLVVGVGLVWKSLKCQYVRQIPWQTMTISLWILGGFVGAAGVLWVVGRVVTGQ